MKTNISQPPYVGLEWGGAGRYSPGATSALTQIVHYSSSYYTVFHFVIYNSVVCTHGRSQGHSDWQLEKGLGLDASSCLFRDYGCNVSRVFYYILIKMKTVKLKCYSKICDFYTSFMIIFDYINVTF